MIVRLAARSLATRPVRTVVLAFGFGLGIGVMAILLGVGEVILEQSLSPALQGGGDAVIAGAGGAVDNARFVLSSVLESSDLRSRITVAAPSKRATLYLITPQKTWPVLAHGGVPSLERAVGDPEIAHVPGWTDTPADRAWAHPDAASVLRAMDRFHPEPDAPEFASSWAEWLYFNGRTPNGNTRFYLTFLVGPETPRHIRSAGVRLQLDREGRTTNYSAAAELDGRDILDHAPDLDIGANHVRLEGLQYRITLDLYAEGTRGSHASGTLVFDAAPDGRLRSLPPTTIAGARGWESGYVVPALSAGVRGAIDVDGTRVALDGRGYHDHNWGFWRGVHWQWGQVAHDDLSFVYGRVFPPASVADASRLPGFLGVIGEDGPIGLSTNVTITERDEGGSPTGVDVRARGRDLNVTLRLSVDRTVKSARGPRGTGPNMTFLQLGGTYHVAGRAGGRDVDFTARGAAETFREAR
jgi:hypothetical protein